jgi:cytochrome b involved in lipid metabolism
MATDSAKSRGKTALEPGYSLMAWMRLSQSGVDLTSGVGAVDMDEGEETWKEWTTAEVMEHNTPEDAWMVLHGKVYNVTPYLRYHPGGVDTLLEAAGGDGTALFDKYHPWVNAVGILGACCLGGLAKTSVAVASSSAAPEVEQPTPEDEAQHTMSVSWDEAGIQAHDAERGIMFGERLRRLSAPTSQPRRSTFFFSSVQRQGVPPPSRRVVRCWQAR